ncbi:MAG: T9SS type A sorting domain-containing protein [Bacteroidales bacterium]|jgi:hypothetical protein|nr:T9SS type A sorting domain-containing protein [Bacteroidales bacterium]
MKKYLLLILFLLLAVVSFAQDVQNEDPQYNNEEAKDTTQINLLELQKLKLYPNPVSDELYVDYDILYVKEASLIIYNSIGATVYSRELKEKKDHLKILVSDFKNGLYFCTLQIDGKLLNTKKILVNH